MISTRIPRDRWSLKEIISCLRSTPTPPRVSGFQYRDLLEVEFQMWLAANPAADWKEVTGTVGRGKAMKASALIDGRGKPVLTVPRLLTDREEAWALMRAAAPQMSMYCRIEGDDTMQVISVSGPFGDVPVDIHQLFIPHAVCIATMEFLLAQWAAGRRAKKGQAPRAARAVPREGIW